MDGSFNGYLPYGQQQQQQQPPPPQAAAQQQNLPQSQPSPSTAGPQAPTASHHGQANHQHSGLSNYAGLSGHQQASDLSSHPTLPPLQGQNGYSQYGSLPFAHPGSQSHTPPGANTPVSSSMSNSHGFSHQPPSMLSHSPFGPPYSMSQSMMYPSSGATSMPHNPATSGLPTIRPMPPGGVTSAMNGLPSLASAGHLGQQPSFMQNEEAPTHVVGSQGRRGILPSAPGRPNPPPQGSGISTKSMIPQKDADGKFPCPHCNKTYLHAKHLKRHLLRHTGDRPYMCHLCKDTFSRSDILKRHFQKCSIRRGNPTGANHLAHQRRPAGNHNNNNNSSNRLSMNQQDGPVGLAGMPEVTGAPYNPASVMNNSPSVNSELSARSSRANSLIGNTAMSHRGGLAGLGILSNPSPNGDQMTSSGAYQPGMAAYAMSTPPNGQMGSSYAFGNPPMGGSGYNTPTQQMSFLGQTSSRFNNPHSSSSHPSGGDDNGAQIDWSRMFNAGGQDGFVGSHPANASSVVSDIKTENTESKSAFHNNLHSDLANESFLGNLYSRPSAFGGGYSESQQRVSMFLSGASDDPLKAKVDSLIHFCFPHGYESMRDNPAAETMRSCLTVDNVKHLAKHYLSFEEHWPTLHLPTFNLTAAYDGLVLAIVCVGAVYSPTLHPSQVRQMMEFARSTVIANSTVYNRMLHNQTQSLGRCGADVEEFQALLMLQNLFIWHGEPQQRQAARNEFPMLVRIVRAMDMCRTVTPGHYAYSILHSSPSNSSPPVSGHAFNWPAWLEQEKRNRVLYGAFLMDAAMALFFNCVPQFDPLELHVMLPADDAAWEAVDSQACANALGLNGALAQDRNVTGTRRPQQLGMHEALRALLDPTTIMPGGATNAYSKFILIHGLIVRIVACQQAVLQPDAGFPTFSIGLGGSGPATPMSQNDWLDQHGVSNSGRATPTDHAVPSHILQDKTRLGSALDKWKRAWDVDTDLQYHNQVGRRYGFSRDGVHFFYLGRSLVQSHRTSDWLAPADVRFQQVIALLKRIKGFVAGEKDALPQETGSVGDIDDQYGRDTLTLDMKLLFKAQGR